ncbi:MAG: hypothetical protein F4Z31_07715 [Gemmatimonadetes bacterium]|nr:hypothetical protein [Gemmatimonadota bacterium]MYJ09143.1 hypothetical protein [Gemmatimonadota bacterium]
METDVRRKARTLLTDSAAWLIANGWTAEAMFRDFAGQPIQVMACPDTEVTIPVLGRSKVCSACMDGALHLNGREIAVVAEAELLLASYLRESGLLPRTVVEGLEGPYDGIDVYNDLYAASIAEAAGAMAFAAKHVPMGVK